MLSQGGIYLVKLNPSKRDDVAKVRPAVILTNQEILNHEPPIIFICPLSSQSKRNFKHIHIAIPPRDSLRKASYALVEHCRSISLERISSQRIAQLVPEEMSSIIERLNLLIDYQ